MNPKYTLSPLGDSALLVDFGNLINERLNDKVIALSRLIAGASITGVRDVVAAYSSITIHYDVAAVKRLYNTTAYDYIKQQIKPILATGTLSSKNDSPLIKVPVCYSLKYGLDLGSISELTKLTIEDIIRIHTSKTYKVYTVGFLPGFAYMGEVDDRITLPRKATPRLQIEQGSVGIAGKQTGIYPLTSPGGWQIIGRTPIPIFDKNKPEPVLFSPGDTVQFFSITADEFTNY